MVAPGEARGSRARFLTRLAIVLVGVFAIVAATAIPIYVASYQPIVKGSYGRTPATATKIADAEFDEPETWRVPYHDGATDYFGFSIRNTGPIGVRVDSIAGLSDASLWRPVSVEVEPGFAYEQFRPFKPFVLAAGKEAWFQITARFENCKHYVFGSANVYEDVVVRTSFWTHVREITIPLDQRLEVPAPEKCPRPHVQ